MYIQTKDVQNRKGHCVCESRGGEQGESKLPPPAAEGETAKTKEKKNKGKRKAGCRSFNTKLKSRVFFPVCCWVGVRVLLRALHKTKCYKKKSCVVCLFPVERRGDRGPPSLSFLSLFRLAPKTGTLRFSRAQGLSDDPIKSIHPCLCPRSFSLSILLYRLMIVWCLTSFVLRVCACPQLRRKNKHSLSTGNKSLYSLALNSRRVY